MFSIIDWLSGIVALVADHSLMQLCITQRKVCSEVAAELLSCLSAHLDAWAMRQPVSSLHVMLHTQNRGSKRARHGHPGLKAAMSKKHRVHGIASDLAADTAAGQSAGDIKTTIERNLSLIHI